MWLDTDLGIEKEDQGDVGGQALKTCLTRTLPPAKGQKSGFPPSNFGEPVQQRVKMLPFGSANGERSSKVGEGNDMFLAISNC